MVDPFEVEAVLQELVVATEVKSPETPSHFPLDLEAANNILHMTVDFLITDLSTNPDDPIALSTVRDMHLI